MPCRCEFESKICVSAPRGRCCMTFVSLSLCTPSAIAPRCRARSRADRPILLLKFPFRPRWSSSVNPRGSVSLRPLRASVDSDFYTGRMAAGNVRGGCDFESRVGQFQLDPSPPYEAFAHARDRPEPTLAGRLRGPRPEASRDRSSQVRRVQAQVGPALAGTSFWSSLCVLAWEWRSTPFFLIPYAHPIPIPIHFPPITRSTSIFV